MDKWISVIAVIWGVVVCTIIWLCHIIDAKPDPYYFPDPPLNKEK